MRQDAPLDQETLDVLKADDILSRIYQNQKTGAVASLFVAYFETQRTGKAPHSPKNCLPGSGWASTQAGMIDIPVPGRSRAGSGEPVYRSRAETTKAWSCIGIRPETA